MRGPHRLAMLGAALALALPAAHAAAGGIEDPDAPRKPRRHRSAVVLLDMNDAVRTERAEGGSFRIRKRYGFEYARDFRLEERPFTFSVQGPALPSKRFGLCFELRF